MVRVPLRVHGHQVRAVGLPEQIQPGNTQMGAYRVDVVGRRG
jgi:hypothetical protein